MRALRKRRKDHQSQIWGELAPSPKNQPQQARTDSRQWREGRGRAGQGRVQWLVVVAVAASETVGLSWLVRLTVDSLSTVDLTSQGFFYILRQCLCTFV